MHSLTAFVQIVPDKKTKKTPQKSTFMFFVKKRKNLEKSTWNMLTLCFEYVPSVTPHSFDIVYTQNNRMS